MSSKSKPTKISARIRQSKPVKIGLAAALLVALMSGSAFAGYKIGAQNPKHADTVRTDSSQNTQTSLKVVHDTHADEIPFNQETFKESFVANCVIQAKTNLSETAAKAYCTCVLDQGIQTYGIQRFVNLNLEIAQTYNLSELKDTINACAAQATASY